MSMNGKQRLVNRWLINNPLDGYQINEHETTKNISLENLNTRTDWSFHSQSRISILDCACERRKKNPRQIFFFLS